MRRWFKLGSLMIVTLYGCVSDDPGTADPSEHASGSAALFSTPECTLRGAGTLATGDIIGGEIIGEPFGASGVWSHAIGGTTYTLNPAWILCRINGIFVADVGGTALVNGERGYSFRMFVQDYDYVPPDPPAPVRETQTVAATRTYSPASWQDGVLETGEHARVVLPVELAVIAGSAGRQSATLMFAHHPSGEEVSCRYRGAMTGYVFDSCASKGKLGFAPGDSVEVSSMVVHVDRGDRRAGPTTVSVDFDVTRFPAAPDDLPRDYYRFQVFQNADLIYKVEGQLATGGLVLIP
jgi:hypothetical protein